MEECAKSDQVICDNAYVIVKRARLTLSLCCNSYLPNVCGK
jgi:hypothetical protein